MKLGVVTVATAAALAAPLAPGMASEGEQAVSLSLGYGRYAVPEYSPSGGVLGVEYERGISDAFSLRLSGGMGLYYGADSVTYSGQLVAGITYLFDVVKYVPYANLGLGAIAIAGGELDTRLSGLIELGVGVDVLHSRRFSYGVQVRFETFVQETSFFTAGVRASWRWGFF